MRMSKQMPMHVSMHISMPMRIFVCILTSIHNIIQISIHMCTGTSLTVQQQADNHAQLEQIQVSMPDRFVITNMSL